MMGVGARIEQGCRGPALGWVADEGMGTSFLTLNHRNMYVCMYVNLGMQLEISPRLCHFFELQAGHSLVP